LSLLVYPLLLLLVLVTVCNPQNNPKDEISSAPEQSTGPKEAIGSAVFGANTTAEIDDNIRSIFQDKNGIYWFGTNAAGVYRYDPKQAIGKSFTAFSTK
jgi:ligand-binding sensor domain-containing protein